jgi:hypothetical protein
MYNKLTLAHGKEFAKFGETPRTGFLVQPNDWVVSFRQGLPDEWINKVKAINELGLVNGYRIRIAHMDFCYSATYVDVGWPDMPWALGIYYGDINQNYVGWYGDLATGGMPNTPGPTYTKFTRTLWAGLPDGLIQGRNLAEALSGARSDIQWDPYGDDV